MLNLKDEEKEVKVNLKTMVVDLITLRDSNIGNRFDKRFIVRESETLDKELTNLNQFWRVQLGLLNIDTSSARECLIDDISREDWLRLFNEHVIPIIIEADLPK